MEDKKKEIDDYFNVLFEIDDVNFIDPDDRAEFMMIRGYGVPITQLAKYNVEEAYMMFEEIKKSFSLNIFRLKRIREGIKKFKDEVPIRANNHLEPCNDIRCKYCASINNERICCFASRSSMGCYIENIKEIDILITYKMKNANDETMTKDFEELVGV